MNKPKEDFRAEFKGPCIYEHELANGDIYYTVFALRKKSLLFGLIKYTRTLYLEDDPSNWSYSLTEDPVIVFKFATREDAEAKYKIALANTIDGTLKYKIIRVTRVDSVNDKTPDHENEA